jgi:hypothetical protein
LIFYIATGDSSHGGLSLSLFEGFAQSKLQEIAIKGLNEHKNHPQAIRFGIKVALVSLAMRRSSSTISKGRS